MILKFLQFEWKRFFRSSYWQRAIGLKILIILMTLYLLLVFLSLGVSGYFLLKEKFPDKDPLVIVNSFLGFWILTDLIMRYFGQNLPEMQIRPFLNLPLKKTKIAQYVLIKSFFSIFVWFPIILFVPFAAVLYYKGYDTSLVTAWLVSILSLIIANNYLNFLVNRNKKYLIALLILLGSLVLLDYFKIVPVQEYVSAAFNRFKEQPYLALFPVLWAILTIFLAYKNIVKNVYLDSILQSRSETAKTGELAFANRLGEVGTYFKNDIRSILRNKRTKNLKYSLLFVPLIGLFYIKLNSHRGPDSVLLSFTTAAFFITMLFNVSYGQFIPSWDSTYYPFIMSQKVNLRKYLESKYLLLTSFSIILFVLSTPYVYYGWQFIAILLAFTVFTIGILNPVLLWNGAYNTKRIDANEKAFGNSQGFSGRNLLVAFLFGLLPITIFIVLFKAISFNVAISTFLVIGITGILLKNYFLKKITKLYIKKKYKTLNGFKQLN